MYDPYAAPAAAPAHAPSPIAYADGAPQPWGVGEMMARAFDIVRGQLGAIMVFNLVYLLVASAGGFAVGFPLALLPIDAELRQVVVQVVSLPLTAFLVVGLMRGSLSLARGEALQIGLLFSGGGRALTMLVAQLLYGLIVAVGFLLLIVPGIVLAAGLALYPYYVAETELGPIEALKASWEATRGRRGGMVGLSIGCAFLCLASLIALCVGFLAGMALPTVAFAVVYLRVRGADPFAPRTEIEPGPQRAW